MALIILKDHVPTFFIVKNRALGDAIMGLSTIQYLRSLYPESNIIYAIPQWTHHLFKDVKTAADIIYPLDLSSFQSILRLYEDLNDFKVDYIFELHQSGRGQKIFQFFNFISNIPYQAHNHHLTCKTKIIDQGLKIALIQRDLDGVFSFLGKDKRPRYLDFEPEIKCSKKFSEKKKRMIIGIVATRNSKMWPHENYVSLIKKLLSVYPDLHFSIPISPSKGDLALKNNFENLFKHDHVEFILKPLNELPRYFSESLIYIGNDTGLKHLSVATKIPSITIFGPEPTTEWHPYDERKHIAFFKEGLSCRTRSGHYCGLNDCDLISDDFLQCQKLISVESVFETAKKIIDQQLA